MGKRFQAEVIWAIVDGLRSPVIDTHQVLQ